MSKTKLKIENLYKIFGPRGKSFIDPIKYGMSKQELLDNHSHVHALNNNILPATLNLDDPIETNNINLIPKTPLEKKISYALSNSFGFGGTNTALLFKSI